jgi:hypothetical protein
VVITWLNHHATIKMPLIKRSFSSLTRITGTLPEVRQRPKVAKRPTIPAPAGPQPKPAERAAAAASAPAPKEAKAAARPANSESWKFLVQLAIGILLGFLAPQIHALAALWKPWGVRLVFPFVQLLALREMGLSSELSRTLPQLMLYLQFPLEGLIVIANLRKGSRFLTAAAPVVLVHFMCVLVLWIVALGAPQPI